MGIQDLRRNYTYGGLVRSELPRDPMQLFQQWFELVRNSSLPEWFEVNAMTLSTTKLDGGTSSRIVLLKAIDGDRFQFFTNYDSAKGREISADPRVAIHFFWPMFDRQVRIEGVAEKTTTAVSDNYFAARPRASQLGAAASPQSQVIQDEMQLEQWIETLDNKYAGQSVPRPANWGGYQVIPNMMEFWQGKPSRLHDRFRYDRVVDPANTANTSGCDEWAIRRLAP